MNGYERCEATDVVAAADTNPESLKEFGGEYDIKALYEDYSEMLLREQLDIVSVCTWPGLHHEMVLAAAKGGVRAVFCEKPLALGVADAREMVEVCLQYGCGLFVSHQRRFEPRYVKAKELLEAGEIGELLSIDVYQGNLFTDDHGIDLMQFFAGDKPVKRVFGQVDWERRQTCGWGHTVENAAIAQVTFEDDVEGSLMAGTAVGKHAHYTVHLKGSAGLIEVSGGNYPAQHTVRLMNARTNGWDVIDIPPQIVGTPRPEILGKPTIEYFWVVSWPRAIVHMVECLGGEAESIITGELAARTIEIIAAIYESSKRRAVVDFPLEKSVDRPLEFL
jgi:predicted dehydrogenase